jgi:thiamine-phosphate pyrophosphorylase
MNQMKVELTPAAERALALAGRLAAAADRPAVAAEDVVAAILAEPEGQAVAVARASGWAGTPPNHDLPQLDAGTTVTEWSGEADAAVHLAARYARRHFVDQTVTTELLLLALVNSDAAMASGMAKDGLDVARLTRLALGPANEPIPIEPAPSEQPVAAPPTDDGADVAVSRVLDAAANRAREALRVLEDFTRLVWDDECLSRALKAVRHRLAGALAPLRPFDLLAARDTGRDVGTRIAGGGEYDRSGAAAVVAANVKRLQEALRSLEEFSKTRSAGAARALEALRYESYSLEQALVLGSAGRRRLADVRLYWLTPTGCATAELERRLVEAIAGGVQMVQLREKAVADRPWVERARLVRKITRAAGVPLIINDRSDIAAAVGADGVHLGQDDLGIADARRLLPSDALIGISTHSLEQVRQAVHEGASYIGVGPTFASSTKSFAELAGLAFVRAVSQETSLPAFVLGGVTADNVAEVIAAGGRRIAVTAAVSANDPRGSAGRLRGAVDASLPVR